MNPIDEQRGIIDDLYRLVVSSLESEYDEAACWFDYQRFDDGSSSIGSRLSYKIDGELKYGRLRYPDDRILEEAVPRLHRLMKEHTGGEWDTFTLAIEADGRVTTKFEYPDQKPST